ncbi:MAG: GNAT family N-acetyltransferase, partial [Acidobacteria bacterium]|nr:GNAT family N-acetyltransferase [Acidobacteriota bacterium]
RSAELQIRIGPPERRRQGLGTEALELLLGHAFDDLNLHRVQLHALATNTSAIAAYEKLGFVVEGSLRRAAYVDGAYVDIVVMGLLADERTAATHLRATATALVGVLAVQVPFFFRVEVPSVAQ